ncbi:MAG: oligosaccharide flippase family protein [Methanolinea sp.]|nr:oligosaccharide flippase family protein [Methanolinea sp.]
MDRGRIVRQILGIETVRRQALITLLANIGITVTGYLSTVYIAHVAGAGVLGAYYLFLAYFSLATLAADGGMGGAAVKKISEGEEEGAYLSAQAAIRAALTIACITAIVFALAPFMQDFSAAGLVPWLIFALTIASAGGIIAIGVYGSGSLGILQVGECLNTVTRVVVQILAVSAGLAVAGMVGGFIAGLLVATALNLHVLRIRPAPFGWRHVKALVPYAAWGFSSSLAVVIASAADTILVGYFLDTTEVGYYRAPLQLAALSLFVATSLSASLFPRMSRWYIQAEIDSIRHALRRALSYSLVIAVPMVIGGLLLADRLLYFLYGSPFVVAAPAFSLLLAAQVGAVFFTLDAMALGASGYPRQVFSVNALASLVLVGGELVLIPLHGITGAAIAVLLASCCRAGTARWIMEREIGVGVERKTLASILLAALLMGVLVWALRVIAFPHHVGVIAAIVIIGAAFYFTILFWLEKDLREEVSLLLVHLGIPLFPRP